MQREISERNLLKFRCISIQRQSFEKAKAISHNLSFHTHSKALLIKRTRWAFEMKACWTHQHHFALLYSSSWYRWWRRKGRKNSKDISCFLTLPTIFLHLFDVIMFGTMLIYTAHGFCGWMRQSKKTFNRATSLYVQLRLLLRSDFVKITVFLVWKIVHWEGF